MLSSRPQRVARFRARELMGLPSSPEGPSVLVAAGNCREQRDANPSIAGTEVES